MNIVNITLGVDTQPCSSITLGRRGENEVTQVVVDFSSWVEEFGAGVITLLAMRSQDTSAYPVVLTLDGNTATWDVTSTDTAYKGSGRAEYIYTVGEQIAKSVVFNTVVMQDIGEPSETPPDPYEEWLERLTELGAETQANAEAAQQSAEDAEQSAQEAAQEAANAEGYAEQAGESASAAQSAEAASESARDEAQAAQASAEASATAASDSADSAAGSASDASSSASDASESATSAGVSATTASTAATAAQTAQSAAEDAAEDAQQAAQQAHVEYEQLSGEVDDLSDEVAQQKSALTDTQTSFATVETTSTSSRAYDVGDLLVYGNRLYKVASVIAAGATLTPGTNITLTTVEGELDGKQDAIAGTFAGVMSWNSSGAAVVADNTTRIQPWSVNNFTTVFREHLHTTNSSTTRSGFTVFFNKIMIHKTTVQSQTRQWMNILTGDGTVHTFTGTYTDENIPINPGAWVDFRSLFSTDFSQRVFISAACNNVSYSSTVSWVIAAYFGYKAGDGTITSMERVGVGSSASLPVRIVDITDKLKNANYNVMTIYLEDRNYYGKDKDTLISLDLLGLPAETT